jgi:oligopeptide/dipeptide ABC transporter ATP-binding protein
LTQPALCVSDVETVLETEHGPIPLVRGVSLELGPGETMGLVGESGCGKTMTALAVMRLLPSGVRITRGAIEVCGHDVVTATKQALQRIRGRRIAMVFQDSMTSLDPVLSVGLQLTETLLAHATVSRRAARARAAQLLEEVGVPEPERRLRQFPSQLSGGLRQRVAIAIALAGNPDVLIADEPTTALDVTVQAQVLELLKREQRERGMALLLITHDLGVVAGMADKLGVMYAGRIVEQGPTDEIFGDPAHPYTIALLRSVPRLGGEGGRKLRSIPGAPPAMWDLPSGCSFRPRCELAFDRCDHDEPPLMRRRTPEALAACWASVREAAR